VKERLGGRLRAAISGGAPLAKEIAEFFHTVDILVLEGYGQTEETTASNVNRPNRFKFGTVGPALPGIEVATAADGEILIKSPTVFAGYYEDEEATRAVLPGDGWLHTGDVGVIDEDGFLTVTDRKKDIIVTAGGKNVSPQNIENLLKGIPWVSQALVVGDRRPYLVALLTLDEEEVAKLDGVDDLDELVGRAVDEVNAGLAHFEQVRRYEVLGRDFSSEQDEVTPTLKLKRAVVEEHFSEELERLYAD
jgi:long-chain acyl-CoA synthetase